MPSNDSTLQINKTAITVTNLSKVYFPEKNITKGALIAYYNAMAPFILPYLKNRPLSLKRNPNGIHGEAFYHKDAGNDVPKYIKTFKIFSDSSHHDINYIVCNNAETLIYVANLGCIEMNPWNSVYTKPDNPTYLLIDLDPADKNDFEQVIETAQAVKEVLDKAKLEAYCKTSGASGLHIYIPLNAKYDYDTVRDFAEVIAGMSHHLVPDFTSLERNLKKRGNNIYIDFLQNRRGQTLASAYCLRPVEPATVSTPIDWKELKKGLHPTQFDIFNIHNRLDKIGDIFLPVLTAKNDISKALKLLGA